MLRITSASNALKNKDSRSTNPDPVMQLEREESECKKEIADMRTTPGETCSASCPKADSCTPIMRSPRRMGGSFSVPRSAANSLKNEDVRSANPDLVMQVERQEP
jgi:hypothetical protein